MRVKKGVASTDEQVAYMEKLMAAHKTLIQAEADITATRLAIPGSVLTTSGQYLTIG